MKINSPDVTNKSDAGGVRLNISNAQAVRSTYNDMLATVRKNRPDARIDGATIEPMLQRPNGRELLVGLITDPVFGPVITFGAGGTAVEVMGDRAVTLPPLNHRLAQDLVRQTRVFKLLGAFRHMPVADMNALEQVLLRVSEIACELPLVKELDINPLIVDEHGAIAVDARVVVDYHSQTAERYSHMAIYPYPGHLVSHWQLPDGTDMVIRPIRPEDVVGLAEVLRPDDLGPPVDAAALAKIPIGMTVDLLFRNACHGALGHTILAGDRQDLFACRQKCRIRGGARCFPSADIRSYANDGHPGRAEKGVLCPYSRIIGSFHDGAIRSPREPRRRN